VTIVGAPLVRERDGLALSSRNTYLSPAEHARALALHEALDAAEADYKAGRTDPKRAVAKIGKALAKACDKVDYVVAVDADTLEPVKKLGPNTLLALAAYVGKTRLIDNHLL
jgi:pantoate--beta-alanine ligase